MARKTAPAAAKREPVSLFKTAAKATPTVAKSATGAKPLVPVPGLMLDAVASEGEKICRTLKETLFRPTVKSVGTALWVDEAVKHHCRPENFRGVEAALAGDGSIVTNPDFQASVELRKRGTNSPLKDEEIEVLEADDVPFAHVPLREGTSSFQLNPAYETDPRLHEWGAKMAELGMPSDLFVQATKPVVTEDTLKSVFELRQGETEQQYRDRLNRLMPICTIVGVKPATKMDDADVLQHLLDFVRQAGERQKEKEAQDRAAEAAITHGRRAGWVA